MKRITSIACFVAEIAAVYFWQCHGIAAVGRLLLFYYWALGFLLLILGVLALLGALLTKTRKPEKNMSAFFRAWEWAISVARVVMLVALDHQVLAAVFLFASFLCLIAVSIYRDVPEEVA